MVSICLVCLEDIEDKNIINCPYCNKIICKNCCQQYLLLQIITYECPYCKKPWNLSFIYSNLSLSFINKQLKENYAKICTAIDNTRFLNPLKEEFNYIKNIDFIIKRLFKLIDFNKNKNYYHFTNQTIDNDVKLSDFLNFYLEYRPKNYWYNITHNIQIETPKEYTEYIEQMNFIKKIYPEFIELIDYNTFLDIFSSSNYKLYTIFIFYNILIDKFDELKNNYYNNYFNINRIDVKYFNNNKPLTKKIIIHKSIEKFDYYKTINKYEIVKILHELISPFKNKISVQQEKVIKRKNFKCIKPNCEGTVYKYEHQAICNACKSIFCSKCHTEIFPEKIEYSTDNVYIQTIINPKYNEYTKEQKQGKYPEEYIKLNFKLRYENKELTDEEKKDKFIKYYQLLNHVCTEDDLNNVNLLTDNVKNCPKCSEPIFKSSGCDHMWCVKCHTMFNWSDLKITKTTTNPLYFQWLKQQGITPARYDHPDAQPGNQYNECVEQLNFNQCLNIINNLDFEDEKMKEKLIRFAKLIELVPKPQNEGYMTMYRMKYAYNLIDEKQYIKYLSTRYTSKFFIDNYNTIIVNTIFMISEFFKYVKENKKFNLNEAKEIITIHNDAIKDFNNIYNNFRINFINNEFIIETKKDDKNIIYKLPASKYQVKIDPTKTYLECPYPNLNNDIHQEKLYNLYKILCSSYITVYNPISKYNLKYMFPKKEKVNNIEFINIINNNYLYERFNLYKNNYSFLSKYNNYYNISKDTLKYIYNSNPQIYNKYANVSDYIYKYIKMLTEFIMTFLQTYNMSKIEILQLYDELKKYTIYDENNLKDTFNFQTSKDFEPYKKRAQTLQKCLKYYYKYKHSQLFTELHKININIEKITNNTIFEQKMNSYCYIIIFEKPLMDILIKIQN